MALVDNSQLLTTLYGLAGAKKSGNREQYQILKAQFDNDLLNIKLKNQTSSLSQLQSAYDKKDKALQDVTEKVDIYNRQMEYFQNPQKYPAWQSNPYISANMLGADPQVVGYARDRDLLNKIPPQYQNALRAGVLGGDGGVQNRILNNDLLNQQQAHPIVQQNIASIGTGTTAEQNTAIAAYNNSQANLTKAQTAQGESVQGKLALIDISYPKSDDAQKQLIRGIAIAKAFGIDENLAAVLGMANKDELSAYLNAKASDPVQADIRNERTGSNIPHYAPQRPTNPPQSPGDKGRAAYEEERATMLAAAMQAKWTPKQIEAADQRLAAKYGLVPKPKDPSGAGGISTLTKDYYKGLVNIAIATANRFNVEGLPDGESIAFNDVAILLSLQNALTSELLVGSSPEDLDTFARIFTAELGESIKQAGADGQSAVSQSMLNLVANGAQLHQKVLTALRISKETGRRFTLADLGYTREEIAKIATTAARLTDDEVLTAGIKQLIPNYDAIVKDATTDPLPETVAPSVNPNPSTFIPPQQRTPGYAPAESALPGGYRTGTIVQIILPDGKVLDNYEITGAGENGQLKIAKAGAPRNFFTKRPEGERTIDPKYLVKPEYKEGDTVKIDRLPSRSKGAEVTQYVMIVKMGPVSQFVIPGEPQTKVDVDKDSILVRTSAGEYTLVPKSSLLGKVINAS